MDRGTTEESLIPHLLHEIREDIREFNKDNHARTAVIREQIQKIDERIDQHAKYWSITFFIWRAFAWIIATTIAIMATVKGWFY